jgi:hypothetical protein
LALAGWVAGAVMTWVERDERSALADISAQAPDT